MEYAELDDFIRRLDRIDYIESLNYFRWMEYPLALAMMEARPGMRVLEVGAGKISGVPLYLAGALGCEVTTVDLEPVHDRLLGSVQRRMERLGIPEGRLNVLSMDAANLEMEDNSFDIVYAISVLEHVPLSKDSKVIQEMGRVLKPGGRLFFSVPCGLGGHIESESWGGQEYEQRHYNEYTLRERLVQPAHIHFVRAVAIGEVDGGVGRWYLSLPEEEQKRFTFENVHRASTYWREYYRVEDENQFVVHRSRLSQQDMEDASVTAVLMEKRNEPLPQSYFPYDPLRSYLENQRLCKTKENGSVGLKIEKVELCRAHGGLDPSIHFQSAEAIDVFITFACDGEVQEPTFRVLFQDRYDNVIVGLTTSQTGFMLGTCRGRNRLRVRFDQLNLLPGEYWVTVGAWEYEQPDPVPPFPYDVKFKSNRMEIGPLLPGLTGTAFMPYNLAIEKLPE